MFSANTDKSTRNGQREACLAAAVTNFPELPPELMTRFLSNPKVLQQILREHLGFKIEVWPLHMLISNKVSVLN